jgi:hypothetical protein
VRLVREQEAERATSSAVIRSVAAEVGPDAETLRPWPREAGRDNAPDSGSPRPRKPANGRRRATVVAV